MQNEKVVTHVPYDLEEVSMPQYIEMKGWKRDISNVSKKEEMPDELQQYIAFIEKETGVPVSIVSLGPDRKQIIFR